MWATLAARRARAPHQCGCLAEEFTEPPERGRSTGGPHAAQPNPGNADLIARPTTQEGTGTTTRLGIGLPQNRQYNLGRDVPDVVGHRRAGRPAAHPLPTRQSAGHVGRGERGPGGRGTGQRLVPRRVRGRRGAPVRGARQGHGRGVRRMPGSVGTGPGGLRGRPGHEDRLGRGRTETAHCARNSTARPTSRTARSSSTATGPSSRPSSASPRPAASRWHRSPWPGS